MNIDNYLESNMCDKTYNMLKGAPEQSMVYG